MSEYQPHLGRKKIVPKCQSEKEKKNQKRHFTNAFPDTCAHNNCFFYMFF